MSRFRPNISVCLLVAFLVHAMAWGAAPSFFSAARIRRSPGSVPDAISSFLVPTEHNPGAAIPILRHARKGTYVSVGFERAFIGAAITPRADSLLVLDIDELAVYGVRSNAGLLALAKDRPDYLQLRFGDDYDDLRSRVEAADLPRDYRRALLDATYFPLFQSAADWETPRNRGFFLMRFPAGAAGDFAFRDGNYFQYDRQFRKLSHMAGAGNISSALLSLADTSAVRSVATAFKRQTLSLSVLDISDTWWWSSTRGRISFLQPEELEKLIAVFSEVADDDSILLLSSNTDDGSDGKSFQTVADSRFPGEEIRFRRWGYLGVTFRHLRTKRQRSHFVARILEEYDRGNGFAVSGTLNPRRYLADPPHCAELVSTGEP